MNDTFDLFDTEEITQETDTFKIETAAQADWGVEIKLERIQQYEIFKQAAIAKIQKIKLQLEEEYQKMLNDTAWIDDQLIQWAATAPLKKAKTQASIQLPSGRLVVKYGHQKLEPVKDKMIEHYEASGDYIRTKKELDWAELKKDIVNNNGTIINTKTGEIISDDLIKIVDVPPQIEVK